MAFWRTLLNKSNLTRPILGGAIGGIAGGAMSDNQSATGTFRDMLLGAAAGAGIGTMATPAFWGAARATGKGIGKGIWNRARPLFTHEGGIKAQQGIERAVLGVGDAAARAGKFAMSNPKTALLLGGGAFGVGALGMSVMGGGQPPAGREDVIDFMRQNKMSSTADLHGSTFGLVQGLHKGRHG